MPMASEVQECSNTEDHCLPTGSISFGRFESETLTWERRSSFSHNRYLEEVERCSTPGSVIKKKAYFEAHFKKTALRNLDLFGRQNEAGCRVENGVENQENCVKEFRDSGNGELCFEDFEHQEIQFSWYDGTPDTSDEEQHASLVIENKEALPLLEVANSNGDKHEPISKTDFEQVQLDETVRSLPGDNMTESGIDGNSGMVIEENYDSRGKNVKTKHLDSSSKSSVVKKLHSTLKQASKSSHLAKSITEQKSRKMKSEINPPTAQMRRKLSSENSHTSARLSSHKNSKQLEKRIPVSLKQPSTKISSSTYPASKKSEVSDNTKVKGRTERGSDKVDKTKNSLVPSMSFHQNGQDDARKSVSRDKRATSTSKLSTRNNGANFSFKSEERAEKRKEYYMKLEHKHDSKEVEMNDIQAKKQVETEAEVKQFRRTLNFKSTPMPSFYQGACPKVPDRQKAINGSAKLRNNAKQQITNRSRSTPGAYSPLLSKPLNSRGPPSATSKHSNISRQKSLEKSVGDNDHAPEGNGASKSEGNLSSKQIYQSGRRMDAGKREDRTKSHALQLQGLDKIKKKDEVNNLRRGGVGKVIKGMTSGNMVVRVAS